MLCRSCRDHTEAFQNHGCHLPLLSNIQNWHDIVTAGLVTPPWRLLCPLLPSRMPWRNEWKVRTDTLASAARESLLTILCLCLEAMLELSSSQTF
jgi:hypothetical protein